MTVVFFLLSLVLWYGTLTAQSDSSANIIRICTWTIDSLQKPDAEWITACRIVLDEIQPDILVIHQVSSEGLCSILQDSVCAQLSKPLSSSNDCPSFVPSYRVASLLFVNADLLDRADLNMYTHGWPTEKKRINDIGTYSTGVLYRLTGEGAILAIESWLPASVIEQEKLDEELERSVIYSRPIKLQESQGCES